MHINKCCQAAFTIYIPSCKNPSTNDQLYISIIEIEISIYKASFVLFFFHWLKKQRFFSHIKVKKATTLMYSHHKTKVNQNEKLSASRSVIYLHLSLLSNKQNMLCEEAQSEESSGCYFSNSLPARDLSIKQQKHVERMAVL